MLSEVQGDQEESQKIMSQSEKDKKKLILFFLAGGGGLVGVGDTVRISAPNTFISDEQEPKHRERKGKKIK